MIFAGIDDEKLEKTEQLLVVKNKKKLILEKTIDSR